MTRDLLERARAALRSEPRIRLHEHPVHLRFADGVMTVEGEVSSPGAKKLALERVAAFPEVNAIVDRLHVAPAERMGDGRIRDLARGALLGGGPRGAVDPRGAPGCASACQGSACGQPRRDPDLVEYGIVTLSREVSGLGLKRLAGVLAWWVPGSRDVVNGIAVVPPEEDTDDEMTDAVRIALEKDTFVEAAQVRVGRTTGS
jgi:osmotically-inducible protein OsmY